MLYALFLSMKGHFNVLYLYDTACILTLKNGTLAHYAAFLKRIKQHASGALKMCVRHCI